MWNNANHVIILLYYALHFHVIELMQTIFPDRRLPGCCYILCCDATSTILGAWFGCTIYANSSWAQFKSTTTVSLSNHITIFCCTGRVFLKYFTICARWKLLCCFYDLLLNCKWICYCFDLEFRIITLFGCKFTHFHKNPVSKISSQIHLLFYRFLLGTFYHMILDYWY